MANEFRCSPHETDILHMYHPDPSSALFSFGISSDHLSPSSFFTLPSGQHRRDGEISFGSISPSLRRIISSSTCNTRTSFMFHVIKPQPPLQFAAAIATHVPCLDSAWEHQDGITGEAAQIRSWTSNNCPAKEWNSCITGE